MQLTPPGSGCSIAFGEGMGEGMEPGSLKGLQLVVDDAERRTPSSPAAGSR